MGRKPLTQITAGSGVLKLRPYGITSKSQPGRQAPCFLGRYETPKLISLHPQPRIGENPKQRSAGVVKTREVAFAVPGYN